MECIAGVANPCPTTLTGPASQLFLTLISSLLGSQCNLGPEGLYPPDHAPLLQDGDEFDFIVVGAGSAGSIVANRLSQVPEWKILLLEAGTYPSAISEIPAMFLALQESPEDWKYVMEPSQTCCLSLKDRSCQSPRGKVLGGSSTINAMMYVRGNRRDFDSWSEAGNPGWDYNSMVNKFKKFENIQDQDGDEYGKNGELKISRYVNDQPIRKILEEAYRELGYTKYKENKPLGFSDNYNTVYRGTRSTTAKAFIASVKDRKNLYVTVNAHVVKLLTNKAAKSVNGVEVKINNKTLKIKAKKEVILSAGSINSPQILMNSGIGPKEHLNNLGIEVIQDLNVGNNLQDHVVLPMFVKVNKPVVKPKTPTDLIDELYQYFMHREGPLGKMELTNFINFINTKNNSIFPNLQIMVTVHYHNDSFFLPEIGRTYRLPEEVTDVMSKYNEITNSLVFYLILLTPKSLGKVMLRSADPFEKPMIFPNYLSDDGNEDLEVVAEGIRFLEKLFQTKTLKKFEPEFVDYNVPNCRKDVFATENYWKCIIRNIASNLYHPVGTCKMGPRENPTAVLDPRLRVHGIKGIRVIDGSIMPVITSGNTNAPIIAIGEKGAELIKEDWISKRVEL